MDWRARVRDLWSLLDSMDELGFSLNPLDIGANIRALWSLVERGWAVATEAPPGDTEAIAAAADDWFTTTEVLLRAGDDFESTAQNLDQVWQGEAAEACAQTLTVLGHRSADSGTSLRTGAVALATYGEQIRTAQVRHEEFGSGLRAAGDRIELVAPWNLGEMISEVLTLIAGAVHAAIDAYTIAGEATEECQRALDRAVGDLGFPPSGAPGLSALETMRVEHSADGRTRPPLHGDVAERAASAYDDLSSAEQAQVDAILDDAPSEEHRAWVLASLAGGALVTTLDGFARRIAGLDAEPGPGGRPSELARALDPSAHELAQETPTTCGSAALTYARMYNDPVYALAILDGYDATSGATNPGSVTDRFGAAEQEVMARTNSTTDPDGNFTWPWPKQLGTPPWGAAEEMNHGAGVDGTSYEVDMIDSDSPDDRQQAYDDLARNADGGRVSPLYVGGEDSPRHVVLVVDRVGEDLVVYDPANGQERTVSEQDFVDGELPGYWERPWAAVTP